MLQLLVINAPDKTFSSRSMGGIRRGAWWGGGREGGTVFGARLRPRPAHQARLLGLGPSPWLPRCLNVDFSADTFFLRAQRAQ